MRVRGVRELVSADNGRDIGVRGLGMGAHQRQQTLQRGIAVRLGAGQEGEGARRRVTLEGSGARRKGAVGRSSARLLFSHGGPPFRVDR